MLSACILERPSLSSSRFAGQVPYGSAWGMRPESFFYAFPGAQDFRSPMWLFLAVALIDAYCCGGGVKAWYFWLKKQCCKASMSLQCGMLVAGGYSLSLAGGYTCTYGSLRVSLFLALF